MKVAVSSTGPNMDADIDPRFGRCPYFIIIDTESMAYEALENTIAASSSGAGISTTQMITNIEVQAVLTGNCGPNAYQILEAAGIKLFTGISGNINDAIATYKNEQFSTTSKPNVSNRLDMSKKDNDIDPGMDMYDRKMISRDISAFDPISQDMNQKQEVETLKAKSKIMAQQLSDIKHRIEELEKKIK